MPRDSHVPNATDSKTRKTKYELNKHRRLSRDINSRIFQSAGKLYLVSHAPVLAALEEPCANLKLESFVNGDQTVAKIAFAGASDSQLTFGRVSRGQSSLEQWRSYLAHNSRNKSLNQERIEVGVLRERDRRIYRLLARSQAAFSLVLSPTQQDEFDHLAGSKCRYSVERNTWAGCLLVFRAALADDFSALLSNTVFYEEEKLVRIENADRLAQRDPSPERRAWCIVLRDPYQRGFSNLDQMDPGKALSLGKRERQPCRETATVRQKPARNSWPYLRFCRPLFPDYDGCLGDL